MRHGEAEPAGGLTDFNRKLTRSGIQQVHEVGKKLDHLSLFPQGVLVSNSVRTEETFHILRDEFLPPIDYFRSLQSLYLADYNAVMSELAEVPPNVDSLLLIGHNPGWSEIVQSLSGKSCMLGTSQLAVLLHSGGRDWVEAFADIGMWSFSQTL